MPNFRELLDERMDDVKRPALLPAGSYEGTITRYEATTRKYQADGDEVPVLALTIQPTGPGEDVDEEQLVDDDGTPIDLSKRVLRYDFNIEKENRWRLKEFLEGAGVDIRGRSFSEALVDLPGTTVLMTVVQKQDKRDTSVMHNNVSKIAPANS